ncbi:MAG: hypothetical protein Q9221_000247 [Calogaya cf. arnoldii]
MSTGSCRPIKVHRAISKIAMFICLDPNRYGIFGHLSGLRPLFRAMVQLPPLIEPPPPWFVQDSVDGIKKAHARREEDREDQDQPYTGPFDALD